MSKYRHGLVVGKFMPLHSGHMALINRASAKCEHLTIILVSKSWEPIPGHLRIKWLRDQFSEYHTIAHLYRDDIPDNPRTTKYFMDIWVDIVNEVRIDNNLPPYDAFFTGSDYDSQFADAMGVSFESHDRNLEAISATMIREDPYKYWDNISFFARPYFAKRVRIVGGESTGKTRLAKNLANYYDSLAVLEVGRTICEEENIKDWDQKVIDKALVYQYQREERYASLCKRILFCDTDAMTTYICAEIGLDFNESDLTQLHMVNTKEYDLTLLCAPDIPWVQDDMGLRSFEDKAQLFFNRFKYELESRYIPYHVIQGENRTEEDSLRMAVDVINKLIPEVAKGRIDV